MYWLVVELQGEIGLISLQERYLDKRLEVNPEEIVFYAELTTEPRYDGCTRCGPGDGVCTCVVFCGAADCKPQTLFREWQFEGIKRVSKGEN